jgi:ParB-like chromosome segregation protein Spo0J
MKLIEISVDALELSQDLARTGSAKQFEERLRSSIQAIGLTEPLKVAPLTAGRYLVIDGAMRLRAVQSIRAAEPSRFNTVAAYVHDYDRRYELRYQSDIYQDLLPSQLAQLVEHLHATEHVRKVDIARYIGVSPATLRNYTGLWRLIKRGGLFAAIVELMDVEMIPASNPYAWLRLTAEGMRKVLEDNFTDGERAEEWIQQKVAAARQGDSTRFPIKFVEATTDALAPQYYREGEELRLVKRDLGQRRGKSQPRLKPKVDNTAAFRNLKRVSRRSPDAVLRLAARSLQEYLQ